MGSLEFAALSGYHGGLLFLERMRSQNQGEQVGVVRLQVLDVVKPFTGQVVIHSSDVASKVLQVLIGKAGKRRPSFKLFIQVGSCPEQIGEAVMLQQTGILEQRQQEFSLLRQKCFEPSQVYVPTVDLNSEVAGEFDGFSKVFLRPALTNAQVPGNLQTVIEMSEEVLKEVVAHFTEESSYHHIELLQFGLPLPASQEALDDNHHQQDLEGQKGQITNHVDKYMVNIAKNEVVNEIGDSGKRHERDGQVDHK